MGQPRSTYRLRSKQLLNELMKDEWSIRALAEKAGCKKSMIWNLTTDNEKYADTTCSEHLARAISEALGIKLLALFAPVVSTDSDSASTKVAA